MLRSVYTFTTSSCSLMPCRGQGQQNCHNLGMASTRAVYQGQPKNALQEEGMDCPLLKANS